MAKTKSEKNKTIDFSVSEGKQYLSKCIKVEKPTALDKITNKTILGDTLSVIPNLPDKSIDLLLVDPPYNLTKNYAGKKFNATDSKSYIEYTDKWISAIRPKLKDTASIYVCCDWICSCEILEVLRKYFIVRNRITWQREKGRGASANWKNGMEDVWFATVSNKYTFNVDKVKIRKKVIAPYKTADGKAKDWFETEDGQKFRDTYPSNFWDDISIPYWSMPENTAHPTQKPEKLIAKLMLASSNENDFVFDCFLGSGTTSVVAKKLNRKYCGIELMEQYCAWSEFRLNQAETNKEIQGITVDENGNYIFWERNTKAIQDKLNKEAK